MIGVWPSAGLKDDFAGHSLRAGFATAAARGPVDRRPRSCATAAGRAYRSPAARSAKGPVGAITPPLTSDCNRWRRRGRSST
jgi:hypothetical protein